MNLLLRACLVLLLLVAAAAGLFLVHCYPEHLKMYLPPCLFYKFTNLYCPGCGGTRAFFALSRGDFSEAFSQNAILFFLIPLAFMLIVYPRIVRIPYFCHFILFVIVGYFILRNLEAFHFLAPH